MNKKYLRNSKRNNIRTLHKIINHQITLIFTRLFINLPKKTFFDKISTEVFH